MQDKTKIEDIELLDTTEACKVLRISRNTLQKRLKAGLIKRSGASTGRNFYPLQEIKKLIGCAL